MAAAPILLTLQRGRASWSWIVLGLVHTLLGTADAAPLREGSTAEVNGRSVRVVTLASIPVVDSEYRRRHRFDSIDNPKLVELRARYRLPEVVSAGRSELGQQVLLMDWTHRQFQKFGPPSTNVHGALEILGAIQDGHTFFCSQYAQVLVSAASSLGWVCRPLALRRHQGVAAVGGSTEHSVTEIWSNQHAKWVMLDPTGNFYVEREGVPLNAYEIRQEWFYQAGTNLVLRVGRDRQRYRKSDLPVVLGRFDGFGELAVHPDELDKYGFIGFIPNSDLMDSGFDYGGMFIVQDELCRGTRWHQRRIPENPDTDSYFPVGQAALRLESEPEGLRVHLSTFTPNFERFELKLDDGTWTPSADSFLWPLKPGMNRLEARTRNRLGVVGPVSSARVERAD